jgi:lipopolysaccharide biosynthesis protein
VDVKAIAFYLPQYHPIPENDRWWGAGFTEWRKVVTARARYRGHRQPRLPLGLGYYDLRLPEARAAQAALASAYGIHGFCYYHYWFEGRRLLERPFEEVLRRGEPDFPFCLCWVNEPWTRRWDGESGTILLAQTYSRDDDLRHIEWLSRAFADPRYIRVHGRPLFLVYRASQLPNARATTDLWRTAALRLGMPEPYLCMVQSAAREIVNPSELGFDASVEFQPDWTRLGLPLLHRSWRYAASRVLGGEGALRVYRYPAFAERMLKKPAPAYMRFPGVMTGFDDTPRCPDRATVFAGSTPERFGAWLAGAVDRTRAHSQDERLVFINAWNEWAEGAHLEPCQEWELGYLEACRDVLVNGNGRVLATLDDDEEV